MTIAIIVTFSFIALFLPVLPVLPVIDAWRSERRKVDGRLILPPARVEAATASGTHSRMRRD